MARTALSSNTKRATVFAEGMRRLSSLDQRTTEKEKQEVLGQYMHTLVMSGYSHKVRQDTLLGLLEREKQMAALPQKYRSRDQIKNQKQES